MRLVGVDALAALVFAPLSLACGGCDEDATQPDRVVAPEPPPVPGGGVDPGLLRVLEEDPGKRIHLIVAFERRLTPDDHAALRALGVELLGRLGNDTYTASIPGAQGLRGLGELEVFRFAAPIQPGDRISPSLAEGSVPHWARSETVRLQVVVEFFPDVAPDLVASALRELHLDVEPLGTFSWSAVVDRETLAALSRVDGVRSLSPGPKPFIPLNSEARKLTNTNAVHGTAQPPWNFAGSGVKIGICDGGIDEAHLDFQPSQATAPPLMRFYHSRPAICQGIPSDCIHGTFVASIAAGNGAASAGAGHSPHDLRGHAPGAELGDYPHAHAQLALWHSILVDDQTDVTNHSYVQAPENEYDAEAAELDRIVRGDADFRGVRLPARPQIWGAGNFGTCEVCPAGEWGYYSVVTTSKNPISVGSVDTVDGDDPMISDFSSPGPTYDGRIKPDVVAPGCCNSLVQGFPPGIRAASAGGTGGNAYLRLFGTSAAAPVVAAIAALMAEKHSDSATEGAMPLAPSTYKAILVHTARDLVKTTPRTECACCQERSSEDECCPERAQPQDGRPPDPCTCDFKNPDTLKNPIYHEGPDFMTGWGLVDAKAAVALVSAAGQWKEESVGATAEADVFCMTVPRGTERLQVTLAWDDAPGETLPADPTKEELVNDLDLVLVAPDGSPAPPWTLDPPLASGSDPKVEPDPAKVKPATRGADHRNNVEMVSADRPAGGTWKAVVSGFDLLPSASPQRYSVVTSQPFVVCPRE